MSETGDVRQVIERLTLERDEARRMTEERSTAYAMFPAVTHERDTLRAEVERLKAELESKRVKVLNQHEEIKRLRAELAAVEREVEHLEVYSWPLYVTVRRAIASAKLASPPAPSGWQPIESAPVDGEPFQVWLPEKWQHSHVHTATFHPNVRVVGGLFLFDLPCQPTHWSRLPPGPHAKDALPPQSATATLVAFLDYIDMFATDVQDPEMLEQVEAAREALKVVAPPHGFSLGQAFVSRVTTADGPEVSVIGVDVEIDPATRLAIYERALKSIQALDFKMTERGRADFHSGPGKFVKAWLIADAALKLEPDAKDALPPAPSSVWQPEATRLLGLLATKGFTCDCGLGPDDIDEVVTFLKQIAYGALPPTPDASQFAENFAACNHCGVISKQVICPHCGRERDSGILPIDSSLRTAAPDASPAKEER
jgi:hypothetical protein